MINLSEIKGLLNLKFNRNDELGKKYPKALKQDIKDGKKVFE